MPASVKDRETEARFKMLEQLADYDDELMEQLLSDVQPPRDKVFADLVKELQRGPDRAGAAGLGRERQRHPAPAEGAAPRGTLRRPHGQAAQARERQVGRARHQDALHPARRQAVDRARADGRVRRRHGGAGRQVRGACRRRFLAAGPGRQEARRRQGRRYGGARTPGENPFRRDAVRREGRRHADQGAGAARSPCTAWPSASRTARTR